MLDEDLKDQLKEHLGRLTRPVEIAANLGDDPASRDIKALIQELVSLSPMVRASDELLDSTYRPAFALRSRGESARIQFAGAPMGHEFTSLVLALLHTGGHAPRVEPHVIEQIKALEGEFRFETFVSLSCHSCPDVIQALNLMAALNPRIHSTMIDGALFPDEIARRNIMGVPAVFLNGQPFGQGRMELPEILARLDQRGAQREAARLGSEAPFDVLVVGGGPAGAASAVYAARKGIRTGLLSERFGGQLLDTVGVENFISVPHTEGHQLAAGLQHHVAEYGIPVMNNQRATALVPGALHELRLASGATLKARTVVISTGARWREINVPGEREYRNKGVAYCPHCDGPLFKGKPVAVIGGGNSGVEAAIDLAGIVSHVTLIEFDAQLRADAVLQARLRSLSNVTVITHAQTTEVLGDGQRVTGLACKDRGTGRTRTVELAGVFVQIGLVPNTDWLKGTLKLSARGEIEVDARGQTSIPGIFAAGDCTVVPYKQIVIAMGEGAKASLSAFDHLIRTPLSAAA